MNKRKTKFLFVILAAVMIFPFLPAAALGADIGNNGTCGDHVTWTLNNDGLLTISGTGDMYDYDYIGSQNPFFHSSDIKAVVIENGVTSIGANAFSLCRELTTVTISNSVASIGIHAFDSCDKLANLTIPNSIASIGLGAFQACSALTSVTIPNALTSIEDYVFQDCYSLTSITIPNNVTSIGAFAFSRCNGASKIKIGKGVTSIDECAFFACTALEAIEVDPENIAYHSAGNCLIETDSKALIVGCKNSVIPKDGSVTSIGEGAFRYCRGLKRISIPNSVTSIGEIAFDSCTSLTSVSLPDSLTGIAFCTFHSCIALTDIYYSGTEDQWNAMDIDYSNDFTNVTIHFGVQPELCEHVHTKIWYAIPATCIDGYSGDTYCIDCGELIRAGEIIPAVSDQHSFGAWNYCDVNTADAYRIRFCANCDAFEKEDFTMPETEGTFKDDKESIQIDYPNNAFDEGTEFVSEHLSLSDENEDSVEEVWYIAFFRNGEEVQPKAPVILRLKYPAWCTHPEDICLWHYYNGEWREMDTWLEDGYICCITDCFSPFMFTERGVDPDAPAEPDTPLTPGTSEANVCKYCGQTHTGFLGKIVQFFHNIAYFFMNLFKK